MEGGCTHNHEVPCPLFRRNSGYFPVAMGRAGEQAGNERRTCTLRVRPRYRGTGRIAQMASVRVVQVESSAVLRTQYHRVQVVGRSDGATETVLTETGAMESGSCSRAASSPRGMRHDEWVHSLYSPFSSVFCRLCRPASRISLRLRTIAISREGWLPQRGEGVMRVFGRPASYIRMVRTRTGDEVDAMLMLVTPGPGLSLVQVLDVNDRAY
ncbi:hypothetical protein LY78DRAFT_272582 [Colletotrichum sublineola]|nr:hypothetical protein LY78DRAFT_272582 [Colletotrichum sublineola]